MTFSDLKSRLLELLGRAPATVVYELVTADVNQRLRVKEMEATTTLTEAATVALPADFLSVVALYRDVSPRYRLEQSAPHAINAAYRSTGNPRMFAVVDGNLVLDAPGAGENLQLRYIARQSDLSDPSDTNDILIYFPGVYLYGAMYHHAQLIRDAESAGMFGQQYEAALRQARAADVDSRSSGAPTRVVARHTP